MKITFEIEPYIVIVSSHGVLSIAAKDIITSNLSPVRAEVIFRASTEVLNETWESEGREPKSLEGHDDGMPDMEDPRLERCVRKYIEAHLHELAALRR